MRCRIVTCEREVFAGEAQAVYAQSPEGWFGVLPGHAPAAFALTGPVRVVTATGEKRFSVVGGTLVVDRQGVTVVAERLAPEA